MKAQDLLFGPFVEDLPNFRYVDTKGKPTTLVDFTVPTDGLEAPWGMAQFVFLYDTAAVAEPPRSIPALLEWIKANPGRFTYPAPPDFIGSTFLKHVLAELTDQPEALQRPVDQADFAAVTAPLWAWLEEARPHLWRKGASYPLSGPALHQLLDDGEVDFSLAFNPAEASAAISAGRLPETVRTFILEDGTIGNTHFVAIPFNAAHPAGAMVVADFLMSPEAQAHKQDPRVWGDGTVLDLDALAPEDRARFDALPLGVATLPPDAADAGAPRAPSLVDGRDRGGVAAPVQQLIPRGAALSARADRRPVPRTGRSPGSSARSCRRSATCRRSAASSSRSSPGGVCSPRPACPRRCRSR